MNQIKKIKNALNKSIKAVCQSSREYCRNPEKDFTRRKKLPMDKVIKSVLGFSSKSLANELTDIFSGDTSIASVSALVQQRTKILPTAFEEVFKQFTNTMNPVKQFEGYRLLAVDGSDIHTPTNPDDYDSYFKVKNCSPYNLYHLNALYDLCSNTYLDAVIQKTRKCNEHRALCDMVDRYNSPVPSVFIADRGYESYNNMAHIQQIGQFFLFRIKDIKLILEVVENQMRDNDPPITNITFNRLLSEGYTKQQAKEKIAVIVANHICYTMKYDKPFNEEQYAKDVSEIK